MSGINWNNSWSKGGFSGVQNADKYRLPDIIVDEAMRRKASCPNRQPPACATCQAVVTCTLGKGQFQGRVGQATADDCLTCKINEVRQEHPDW